MHGDFRPLHFPGTPADKIDVEETRERRRQIHDRLRVERLLEDMLRSGALHLDRHKDQAAGAQGASDV